MMFLRGTNEIGRCLGFGSRFLMGGWMMLIMAAVLLLVIFTILHFTGKKSKNQANADILDLLKMKLAKGEISEEEYLRKKNFLNLE
ncbi:MAG: hypothetical protein LLG09_01905 [Negativicutes bacterium]|nr:hypothetical protein [Negativicutes bacterium]